MPVRGSISAHGDITDIVAMAVGATHFVNRFVLLLAELQAGQTVGNSEVGADGGKRAWDVEIVGPGPVVVKAQCRNRQWGLSRCQITRTRASVVGRQPSGGKVEFRPGLIEEAEIS